MTIQDDIEATVLALDRLHEPQRLKKAADLQALANIVGNLDTPFDASLIDEEPVADPRLMGLPARRPAPPRAPGGDEAHDDGSVDAAWDRIARARLLGEAKERGSW